MNNLKVGDRVRNIRSKVYKDEPIVVIGKSSDNESSLNIFERYHIKYLNVYNVSGTNMLSWVDSGDITLDIEYYRNLKIESILDENSMCQ